ncbi:MAG: OsmC family protein [Zoogloeaceae bacterium]|nr:OsmC family protein [Zoogloeaceae bacterium]MCP5255801.1 OsmC family protein [Zoogloeaceae bacterium]
MSEQVTITIRQQEKYRFEVDFGEGMSPMIADEPPPLGGGEGPAPTQVLAAAAANCLTASLLFALTKFKQDPGKLTTTATCTVDRNADNRLRVQKIEVAISLGRKGEELEHLDRILGQFETFCTVSQSLQDGIPIAVTVRDIAQQVLKAPEAS